MDERNEMKNRWTAVKEDLVWFLDEVEDGNRPSFADAMSCVNEAAGMPPPDARPGDDFVEELNKTVHTLLRYAGRTRDYVAAVRDGMRGTERGVLIPPLRRLMEKGKDLPFKVPEVGFLENFIAKGTAWEGKMEEATGGPRPPDIKEVRDLLALASTLPFPLRHALKLQEKVARAMSIKAKVRKRKPRAGARDTTRREGNGPEPPPPAKWDGVGTG